MQFNCICVRQLVTLVDGAFPDRLGAGVPTLERATYMRLALR